MRDYESDLRKLYDQLDPRLKRVLDAQLSPDSVPQSWDEVNCWDDCVIKEEKVIISNLDDSHTCPHLGKEGDFFLYCKARCGKLEKIMPKTKFPETNSPQYNSKVDVAFLQLFCMAEDEHYKKCTDYLEKLKSAISDAIV